MEMLLIISLLLIVLIVLLRGETKKNRKVEAYLYGKASTRAPKILEQTQAIDIKTLIGRNRIERMINRWAGIKLLIGKFSEVKIILFIMVLLLLSDFVNTNFLALNYTLVASVITFSGLYLAYGWLQKRERKKFEESFPVALNMLTSAISSGESITHAIMYVGKTLDGPVADEFRLMSQRLQMGESTESVFSKSCHRFPYPSFLFFVITLRANMERGGQLKDIIQRLNRLMFNNKAIERKKYAMTSEARTSAKIVAAIPFIFLFVLKFISPENFNYILNDPSGRMILYYMIISEFIGIAIIWGLMKNVR